MVASEQFRSQSDMRTLLARAAIFSYVEEPEYTPLDEALIPQPTERWRRRRCPVSPARQSSRAAAGQVRDSDVGHRKPCMVASTARPNDISSVMAEKVVTQTVRTDKKKSAETARAVAKSC